MATIRLINNSGNNFTYTVQAPLPVELTHFTAQKSTTTTDLHWRTATELNNSHFHVQRSGDSKRWENIGTVQGHGSTLEEQAYHFTDREPLPGLNYYRLEQVDYDGTVDYSKVVSVNFRDGGTVAISPNPVADELRFTLPEGTDGTVQLSIFDLTGRAWEQQALLDGTVDVSGLRPGMYFVKLVSAQGQVLATERFLNK